MNTTDDMRATAPKIQEVGIRYCVEEWADRIDAQLAACAAGEWRSDLKGAPMDGSKIMGDFGCNDEPFNPHLVSWDGSWWSNKSHEFEYSLLRNWSIPNPPQVTT